MLRPMKQRFLPALLALLPLVACQSHPAETAPPVQASAADASTGTAPDNSTGSFDYYLLNLSWSPEFCHSHPSAQECAAHAAFVLHGLWPQNNSGPWPENCSNAPGPADPSAYKDIYPDRGLLEHEWRTHGTCSGLGPDAYFTSARTAYQSVTAPFVLRSLVSQGSMTPDEIVSLFTSSNLALPRASLAVSCEKGYLTAVEVCLDKSLHPIACPNVRSCAASVVRVPPP